MMHTQWQQQTAAKFYDKDYRILITNNGRNIHVPMHVTILWQTKLTDSAGTGLELDKTLQ